MLKCFSKIAGASILFLRAFRQIPPQCWRNGERKSDRQAALDADTREVQKKADREKRRLRLGHSDERRRNESERDEREKARSLRAAESEERRRKSLLEMQQQQASPPPPPPPIT